MRPFAVLAVLALAATLLPSRAAGAWSNNPAINTTVVSASGSQANYGYVPDGAGGFYVAWDETRSGSLEVIAQRFDPTGRPLWTSGGLAVTNLAASAQADPRICGDGAGGLIVAWEDTRNSVSTGTDVYAQRFNASGVAQWAANGVLVNNSTGNQVDMRIAADGFGGAILAWNDTRTAGNSNDIYAARINAAGAHLWGSSGVAVCAVTNAQYVTHVVPDASGGGHFLFYDYRNGGVYADTYYGRVSAAGAVVGTVNGAQVAGGNYSQFPTDAIADGFGGIWVVIEDQGAGGGTTNWDLRLAHYNFNAAQLDYTDACNEGSQQRNARMTPDGVGGVFVAWNDTRNPGLNEIYAQRFTPGATPLWTANGVMLGTSSGAGYKDYLDVEADGAGGCYVVWNDSRYGNYGIFGQRVNSSGSYLWTSTGVALSTYPADAYSPDLQLDGRGACVALFLSDRNPGSFNYDIYLQRVDRYGYLGDTEPRITKAKDVPNDQGGKVKLEWDASYLEFDGYAQVSSYYVFRSAPSAAALARGLRLSAAPEDALADPRGTRYVSPLAGQAIAWEYVTSVTANDLPAYSSIVPTTGDSTSLGNPRTYFLVQGRSGSRYWDALPDSGYSVDNLAPLAPAPLTGQYAAGTTRLHWNPNGEADLAGYRLYRGGSAGFVPSESNLVAALADTGFADPAGAPFVYKLRAVDVHGNESPVATLVPSGTVGVEDGTASLAFALAAPWPSPAREALFLRFTLPARATLSLRVLDAAGRAVATRPLGELGPGEHALRMPLEGDSGARLAPGLYFLSLERGGERRTARFTVVR